MTRSRSLHAEESAFLQLTKYGASELRIENCLQLLAGVNYVLKSLSIGAKVINYIDPCPGISDSHILSTGVKPIKPWLFNGAISNAYHWLYDPVMPYNDELTLLLGNKYDDFATQQERAATAFEKENKKLKEDIAELQQKLRMLENEKK